MRSRWSDRIARTWKPGPAGFRPLGLVAGASVYFASGAGRGWQLTSRDCMELRHFRPAFIERATSR